MYFKDTKVFTAGTLNISAAFEKTCSGIVTVLFNLLLNKVSRFLKKSRFTMYTVSDP